MTKLAIDDRVRARWGDETIVGRVRKVSADGEQVLVDRIEPPNDAELEMAWVAAPTVARTTTIVGVPGFVHAFYDDGRITRLEFTPIDHDACDVFDGDDTLDTTAVDGPFWRAMQAALLDTTYLTIDDGGDARDEIVTHNVPIQWRE